VWLGLGLNSPFSLGIQYPSNWLGSINVTQANIQTLNLNYLCAGLDIMYFSFRMKRVLPIPLLSPQRLDLQGARRGAGFNVGLLLKNAGSSIPGYLVSQPGQAAGREHGALSFLRRP
jgi:long-subunit fatty acid transport protein